MASPSKNPCKKCNSVINNKEKFLKCSVCENLYHSACTDVPRHLIDSLLQVRAFVFWVCSSCKDLNPLQSIKLIPKVLAQLEELSQKMASLSQKVASDGAEQNSVQVFTKTDEETVMELERRRANEDRILLSGCDLSTKSKENIVDMLQTELQVDARDAILSVHLPKSNKRMMFVRFKDKGLRDMVLRKASSFKKSKDPEVRNIFCNPVYTRLQLEQLKKTKEELKERRDAAKAAGKDPSLIVIRGLRIVERSAKK